MERDRLTSKADKLPILIVEDDEDDRLLLELALQPFEDFLEICFLEDGEKLISYLAHLDVEPGRPRPELVLLDIQMPKKDGRQALVEIKQDPRLRNIPVVVWTTSSMEEDRLFCMEAGAEGYVTKPDRMDDFRKAVAEIVSERLRPPVCA